MLRAVCVLMSIAIVATLFYISLAPLSAPPMFSNSDKWMHAIVYAGVSCWFVTVLHHHRLWALLGCIGLGLFIEYLQSLTHYRHADSMDALANMAGSLAGLGLSIFLMSFLGRRTNATV